jgi:hypothetical protein
MCCNEHGAKVSCLRGLFISCRTVTFDVMCNVVVQCVTCEIRVTLAAVTCVWVVTG